MYTLISRISRQFRRSALGAATMVAAFGVVCLAPQVMSASALQPSAAPQYRMINIHAQIERMAPTATSSAALGVNAHHQVVGWYKTSASNGSKRPFIWLPEAAYGLPPGAHDLNRLFVLHFGDPVYIPNERSVAYAINDNGVVAGMYDYRPFIWDLNNAIIGQPLNPPRCIELWNSEYDDFPMTQCELIDVPIMLCASKEDCGAYGVSNDDPAIVVGKIETNECETSSLPFKLDIDENAPGFTWLSVPIEPEVPVAGAYAINPDTAQLPLGEIIVGSVSVSCIAPPSQPCAPGCNYTAQCPPDPDYRKRALAWVNGAYNELERINPPMSIVHVAYDVNNAGNIVGYGEECEGPPAFPDFASFERAAFWEDFGALPVILDPAPDADHLAEARAIASPDGEGVLHVVGNNLTANQAVLWQRNGLPGWDAHLLDDLVLWPDPPIWEFLVEAHDISDDLWIAGFGSYNYPPGNRAYLLAPDAGPKESADVGGRNCVGLDDLDLLRAQWGPCQGDCPADLNGDGEVDGQDLVILLDQWCAPG